MKYFKNIDMIRGWFIGNFKPSVLTTSSCEVAVKFYKSGDYEKLHHHKKSTEISNIISGKVKMNDKILKKGDIVVIYPHEGTDFKAITNATTVVVKIPSSKNDKYEGASKWLKKL
jgi:quercetin dioxygenase-like cupin family protein